MMLRIRPRLLSLFACFLATGCTALREIPRSQYAAEPERKHVRVVTRDGLVYEFDYMTVNGDSLTGYRRRDTEGPIEDYATLQVAFEEVQKLSARSIDWTRTGLIGGGVIAAFVVKGMSNSSSSSDEGGESGGGGGRVP
jgi:hypothetical protein